LFDIYFDELIKTFDVSIKIFDELKKDLISKTDKKYANKLYINNISVYPSIHSKHIVIYQKISI